MYGATTESVSPGTLPLVQCALLTARPAPVVCCCRRPTLLRRRGPRTPLHGSTKHPFTRHCSLGASAPALIVRNHALQADGGKQGACVPRNTRVSCRVLSGRLDGAGAVTVEGTVGPRRTAEPGGRGLRVRPVSTHHTAPAHRGTPLRQLRHTAAPHGTSAAAVRTLCIVAAPRAQPSTTAGAQGDIMAHPTLLCSPSTRGAP